MNCLLDARSENISGVLGVVEFSHLLQGGVNDIKPSPKCLLKGHRPAHCLLCPKNKKVKLTHKCIAL